MSKQTSMHKFLTAVLDNDWRLVHISPDEMRQNVDTHNRRFGTVGWLWVEIQPHPKGCKVKKASRK